MASQELRYGFDKIQSNMKKIFANSGAIQIRVVASIFSLLFATGCNKEIPVETLCKSFTFPIKKSEWNEVRKLMHEISIESGGNPPFLDQSFGDSINRRYLNLSIKRLDVTKQLKGLILNDGDVAKFYVIDLGAGPASGACSGLIRQDYELAVEKFSKRWVITESNELRVIPSNTKGKQ